MHDQGVPIREAQPSDHENTGAFVETVELRCVLGFDAQNRRRGRTLVGLTRRTCRVGQQTLHVPDRPEGREVSSHDNC